MAFQCRGSVSLLGLGVRPGGVLQSWLQTQKDKRSLALIKPPPPPPRQAGWDALGSVFTSPSLSRGKGNEEQGPSGRSPSGRNCTGQVGERYLKSLKICLPPPPAHPLLRTRLGGVNLQAETAKVNRTRLSREKKCK